MKLEDLKRKGGECYKSFCNNYDTQSSNFKHRKNGDQIVKLSNPGINIEEDFKKHFSDICN